MRRAKRFILFIFVVSISSGCAVNRSTASLEPSADLSKLKTLYVVKLAPDERGINTLIVKELESRGYKATTGMGVEIPSDVDAVVRYKDKWMWDITMYMLELTITLRDKETDFPLATGNSYHTSLTRLSPEEMIEEVLSNIFNERKSL